MDSNILMRFVAAICLIFLGLMTRFSKGENWRQYEKYWFYFVLIGGFLLVYNCYKYLM